jgi:hypothetical protein
MNFGGNLAFAEYVTKHFNLFHVFSSQGEWRNTYVDKPNK